MENCKFIVLYGSLRKGQPAFAKLSLNENLNWILECKFTGEMRDFGDYPAVIENRKELFLTGDLFEIKDRSVMSILDKYERYDPKNKSNSLYHRKCVRLHKPSIQAWIYTYNTEKDELDYKNKPIIKCGNWLEHLNK